MPLASAAYSVLLSSMVLAAPPSPPAEVQARLDAAIEAKWKALGIVAESPTDDAAYLRRVYLDLTGRVPPPLKAREFLADRDPAKRAKLVDALLAGEEFAEYWGRTWTVALTGQRPIKQEKYDGRVLAEYLQKAIRSNKSYKEIVTELICAEGISDASGPANFLLRYEAKPTDLAGAIGKQFLGVTLQCAQCHDHPFAEWKKDDFWGMAAFFGRVRMFEANNENEYHTAVLETRKGELTIPEPGAKPDENGQVPKKKVEPRFPASKTPAPVENRRQALAAWITAESNPYFARNFVNRVWGQLFGIPLAAGFDRPVTDIDGKHPRVLDLLADDFTASGHDIKRLARIILLSRAYQLSAGKGGPQEDHAEAELRLKKQRNFARFPTRPLATDQLYQSIAQATGHRGPEPDPANLPSEDDEATADKATELLGERALTVQRSLVLLNSDYIHQATKSGARTAQTVVGRRTPGMQVEWLFLATLSRKPTDAESASMLELLKEGKGVKGLEDVLWVLLNSVEFNTNH
jgi:hypothetical protein